MTVHYKVEDGKIVVFGNTYPHKDRIKALGGRFNGRDKTWVLMDSPATIEKLADFCAPLGDVPATAVPDRAPALRKTPGRPLTPKPQDQNAPGDTMTIRDLMQKVHMTMMQGFPVPLWVTGEIQNISKKPSGIFFNISEPKGDERQSSTLSVKALIWRQRLNDLIRHRGKTLEDDILQDGLGVRLLVKVELYQDRGQVSLQVMDIDPNYTKGALALAREKLLKELREKGLEAANKSLRLSPFPFNVGLITAEGSRAMSDFCDQLAEHNFCGDLHFEHSQMQGEQVPAGVSSAIARLVAKSCDVIVITRGGGSAADLRWFDDPKVAYAIAQCPIPIVAAIGHHEDTCVAEMICFYRQKTPTAAAEFIIRRFEDTRMKVDEFRLHVAALLDRKVKAYESRFQRIPEFLHQSINQKFLRLMDGSKDLALRLAGIMNQRVHNAELTVAEIQRNIEVSANNLIANRQQRWKGLPDRIDRNVQKVLFQYEKQLMEAKANIQKRDPSPWLDKGWTQLLFEGGKAVRSVKEFEKGQMATAVFIDGRAKLKVEDIEKRTTHD